MARRASTLQMALPVINGPAIARAYVERNGFVSRIERLVERDGRMVGELAMSCDLAAVPDGPGHWIELFTPSAIDHHLQRARAASAAKVAREVRTWLPGHGTIHREDPFGRMGSEPRAWSAGPDPERTEPVRAIGSDRLVMQERPLRRESIGEVRRAHGK